jgi:hypothetical protein
VHILCVAHTCTSAHIVLCCAHLAVMTRKCDELSYICVYMIVYVLRPESLCDYEAGEPGRR